MVFVSGYLQQYPVQGASTQQTPKGAEQVGGEGDVVTCPWSAGLQCVQYPLEHGFRGQSEGRYGVGLLQAFFHFCVGLPVGAVGGVDVPPVGGEGVGAETAFDGAGFDEGYMDAAIGQLLA